jgi:HSP20 family protein
MAIQRWDPQRDLVRLQDNVNRMFEEVLGRSTAPDGGDRARPGDWRPPLDLCEEAGRFVLRADLPGVAPTDVEIRIEEGSLVLAGERRTEQEAYLRLERPFGPFSARVALPPSVDHDRIQANHHNGVLEVVLPKKREEAPSHIEVGGS